MSSISKLSRNNWRLTALKYEINVAAASADGLPNSATEIVGDFNLKNPNVQILIRRTKIGFGIYLKNFMTAKSCRKVRSIFTLNPYKSKPVNEQIAVTWKTKIISATTWPQRLNFADKSRETWKTGSSQSDEQFQTYHYKSLNGNFPFQIISLRISSVDLSSLNSVRLMFENFL